MTPASTHVHLIAIAIAIAAAALILLLVALLLLIYLRFHRGRAHLAPEPDHEPSPAPRLGLDPSVLGSLPVSVFTSGDAANATECAVCISEVTDGEQLRVLPVCGHGFHLHCVDTWFLSHSTCPLCRSPVGPSCAEIERIGAISGDGYSTDLPNLPTNVLFWGTLDRVSTGCGSTSGGLPGASSGSGPLHPSEGEEEEEDGVGSGDSEGGAGVDPQRRSDEDAKSPVAPVSTRLRSFRRFLSRERRVSSCSSGVDVEQGSSAGGTGGE